MPKIDENKIKQNKKFQRKEYRPWDTNISSDNTPITSTLTTGEYHLQEDENLKENSSEQPIYTDADLKKIRRGMYGPQNSLLYYLLENIEYKDQNYVYFEPMHYAEIAASLETPIHTLKSILVKFKKLDLINLTEYKPGRGGYGCYKMPLIIYHFFFSHKKTC